MQILILGYGEMGHALQHSLSTHHEVTVWSRNSAINLELAVQRADVILFCLPVVAHTEVSHRIIPYLGANSLCLSIAKGLDEAGKPAQQLFSEILGKKYRFGVVYGPMISEEILRDRYAFADIALSSQEDFKKIQLLFTDTRQIYRSCDDMTGLTWCVILKNVYAILFGIADGLQLGDNVRGHLAVAALKELSDIVVGLGGKPGTPYGYAGLGDLITTATSMDSHHHELGRQLALGNFGDISGEGVHTLKMVKTFKPFSYSQYPLYMLACDILDSPASLKPLIEHYFQSLNS